MYKPITISLYDEDIALLDELAGELKKRGFPKANKSALIRYALRTLDPEKLDLRTFGAIVREEGEKTNGTKKPAAPENDTV